MVSVGTQTLWSWITELRSLAEDEEKKSESLPNVVCDPAMLSVNGSSCLPEISASSSGAGEEQRERLSLPQIVPEDAAIADPELQLVAHLATLQLPDKFDSSSSSGEEEEKEIDGLLPPLAVETAVSNHELAVGQLSWPAVLRYLRESESEASKYFSLDREPSQVHRGDQQMRGEDKSRELMGRGAKYSEQEAVVEASDQFCHFCGQPSRHWSLLQTGGQV